MGIKYNGQNLRALTEQGFAANESMASIATDFQNDSELVKILTFIAMLYTPASLMAVSDLKNEALHNMSLTLNKLYLVHVSSGNGLNEHTHLVLAPDF